MWTFSEFPSIAGSTCAYASVCATVAPAPPGPAHTSHDDHPVFSSTLLATCAFEGIAEVLVVEVVEELPTVKFTYDFTIVPSVAITVSLCAPAPRVSAVFTLAAFTSYCFTPSTYTCISVIALLEVALAVTCTGDPVVEPSTGLANVITGVAHAIA